MNKLYLYKKNEFFTYKRNMLLQGKQLQSITSFLNNDSIEDDEEYVVDVSNLADLLANNNSLIFQFEQLLLRFSNETMFIAENSKKDALLYDLRYFFDDSEDLQIEVAEILCKENITDTNRYVRRIIDLNEEELTDFFDSFNSKLYGHDRFKVDFREAVNSYRVFNNIGEHKILSLFLMGDSGVGKTEVARTIHRCLGGKKKIAKVNFGNYSSHDALNSLIGSPLGYIGSDGGELIKRVTESDVGLILIDEFEKAETAIFNYFLDVLENGKIINTQAEEYDVNGYIIVFTSNISKTDFSKIISPELRSRFDYKGMFNVLTNDDKTKFVHFRINDILTKYETSTGKVFEKKIHAQIADEIDVSKYKNMRDLNKKIKDTFVKILLTSK